jgi:hypothetical protein
LKACPCITWALTFAIDPFEQNPLRIVIIFYAFFRIIRYGVIVQMSQHPYPGYPQYLPFAKPASAAAYPIGELFQAQAKLFPASAPL